MMWYYVDQGLQSGPVSDAELSKLYQEGKITADTLVRSSELEQWIPLRDAKLEATPAAVATATAAPTAPPVAANFPNANEVVCAECGRIFPAEDTIRHGNTYVCAGCKPIFLQKLAEGARVDTGEMDYAGFWIRFAAKIVDGLILGIPFMVVYVTVVMSTFSHPVIRDGRAEPPSPVVVFLPFLVQVGFIFVKLAYEIYFLGKYGATPGKMVCKLRVITAEGGRIGYGRAAGRALAEILSGMICYIGYIMVGFDVQKRALHDHICNTRVVFKDK